MYVFMELHYFLIFMMLFIRYKMIILLNNIKIYCKSVKSYLLHLTLNFLVLYLKCNNIFKVQ